MSNPSIELHDAAIEVACSTLRRLLLESPLPVLVEASLAFEGSAVAVAVTSRSGVGVTERRLRVA